MDKLKKAKKPLFIVASSIILLVMLIIFKTFGNFEIGGLHYSTLCWGFLSLVFGVLAIKHVGSFLLKKLTPYYEEKLNPYEFKRFSILLEENTGLGFTLVTIANITYLLYRDLEHIVTSLEGVSFPLAVIGVLVIKGTLFGIFGIQMLRFSAGFFSLLELLFTPTVKKTPTVKDDQILKYILNAATYVTAVYILYMWLVSTFLIEVDWERGFVVAAVIAALGFAFRNILADVLASVVIIIEDQVHIKDYVEIKGKFGKIVELGIRHSSLQGFDGAIFTVPNNDFISEIVVNHSNKRYEEVFFDFTVPEKIDKKKLDDFEKKLTDFVCSECCPSDSRDINGQNQVTLIAEKIIEGNIYYHLEFAMKIQEEEIVTSGKIKYWNPRLAGQTVKKNLFHRVHELKLELTE